MKYKKEWGLADERNTWKLRERKVNEDEEIKKVKWEPEQQSKEIEFFQQQSSGEECQKAQGAKVQDDG